MARPDWPLCCSRRRPASRRRVDPGRRIFEARCARCHGADGNGGDMGPAIAQRLTPLDDQQLDQADSRRAAAQGHAAHRRHRRRAGRPDQVPAHDPARAEPPARADDGADDRRPDARRRRCSARASTICSCGPTTSACTCCAGRATRFRTVTSETGVADLQRRARRQPLHDADPDRQDHRRAAGAAVDVHDSRRRARCRARRSSSTASCT